MAKIPQTILDLCPKLKGLRRIHQGKVRDSYVLPDHPGLMLVVATDRISVFDHVLNGLIPNKGVVLTLLNHFWCGFLANLCPSDFVACGSRVDEFLPQHLRGDPLLQMRSTVVRRYAPPTVEDVVRAYLTGSAFKDYGKDRMVYGNFLPEGLTDGCRLPYPLYTPTSKAETGHDMPLTPDEVGAMFGSRRERLALQAMAMAGDYARKHGLILADTKFEFTRDDNGGFVLADERLTPDSSRFWDLGEWKKAQEKDGLPPSLDKQRVRDYMKKFEVDKLDPEKPADVERVHAIALPDDMTRDTELVYRYIMYRLTGMSLERYVRKVLGVDVDVPKRNILVVVGSKSDMPQLKLGLLYLKECGNAPSSVDVISCHRNPLDLEALALSPRVDVIIACAGMAAALPGVLKASLCANKHHRIPVIGVAMKGQNEPANMAAKLSIEELPGQPVELDQKGNAYFGAEGFRQACQVAVEAEFRVRSFETKPAIIGFDTHELLASEG